MAEEFILKSPYPDAAIPCEVSLPDFVLSKAASYGKRIAYIDDVTGKVVTYSDLVRDCHRLAAGLYHAGLRKGDMVVLYTQNCPEYAVVFMATTLCGAVITGMMADWTPYVLNKVMAVADPKFVFCPQRAVQCLDDMVKGCPSFQMFYALDGDVSSPSSYKHLLNNTLDLPKITIDPQDPALMVATSGTTGDKKAAMMSHYSYIAALSAFNSAPDLDFYQNKPGFHVTLLCRPMSHTYGSIAYLTYGLYMGVTGVLLPDYHFLTILKAIGTYKVTMLSGVPMELIQMLKYASFDQYDVTSLRRVLIGGTTLAESFFEEFERKVLFPTNSYGMTEVCVVSISDLSTRDASAGKLVPNNQVRIIGDATGHALGPNKHGEILIKSPSLFSRYLKQPDLTIRAVTEDGWYKSGDLGYYDISGNLYVIGRIKDMINYDTVKMAPVEIEDTLLEFPGVTEAAVIGVPDEVYNEFPRAYIVLKEGANLQEEEIQKTVTDKLGDSRRIRGGIVFVSDLPKSNLGKVNKQMLKQQFKDEIN